ncbi:membrane-spanning 4-domains subfamily A member 4A-like [Dendrobates tinctorius]|uniref:membrane-spanning 4-domains subfamily A member 4A-like n=1 Tax=Dendrobates tinctorius TaxID=92724 RepID=UPI003CCA6322
MASNIPTVTGPYIVMPQRQSNLYNAQNPYTVPTTGQPIQQLGRFHHEFLKGQPKALGAVQIMVALIYLSLGTVLLFTLDSFVSISTYSGVSYWGAAFYIISGSLSIAAENRQSISLIQASLAMNIMSSLVSSAGIGLYCTDIPYAAHNYNPPCYGLCDIYSDNVFFLREVTLSFLVAASLLEFCVSVSVSAFGCRSLEKGNMSPPQVIIMANDYQNQNAAVNTAQFANSNQLPQGHINTLNAGHFRMPMVVSTTIPEVTATLPQPDYTNRNTAPVYPSLSEQ